ncbi:phage tail assembly protein [Cellulomonas sp. SG140]|uniref:phage tail assembly protein n=1 Tax=Cellulomonas sp. SG140 TaxID=2976536 RepID=UPI0021E90DC4|nr:phage tail assembly protein [Cellulomonas sp. SG140]
MSTMTLDDIRAAAEAKYGSFDVELDGSTVRLVNPLRMTKAKRKAVLDLQSKLNDEGSDQEELLGELIVAVAENPSAGKALVKSIGGDLAMLAVLFEGYSQQVQVGEASASAS